MSEHNFLDHYIDGEKKPTEFKTIDTIKKKDLTIYNINFEKHSNEYNFYDSQELVDEFLFNVKTCFKPKNKVSFKGDFSIENIPNAPLILPNIIDIKTTRYWSTDVYKRIYFNDFIISEFHNQK